jgi:hypothetical protein
MNRNDGIHWTRKVSQAKIRQLYRTDALGIVDEELVDEVGSALYARCRSILLVSSAQAECPRCGHVIKVGWGRSNEDVIACPGDGCSWETTVSRWHTSWRHRDLIGTRAASAFRAFVEQYSPALGSREKILLIDQLIHAFHQGIVAGLPHRSAANNLIEGSHTQVLALLDQLAYGDASTPGLREAAGDWQERKREVEHVRRTVA